MIDIPLPDNPWYYVPAGPSLDNYQTINEARKGYRAVRLQSYEPQRSEMRWSVQWWVFAPAAWGELPQWCLSHELSKPTLVQAAVRFAQAEQALTRRKSVRT